MVGIVPTRSRLKDYNAVQDRPGPHLLLLPRHVYPAGAWSVSIDALICLRISLQSGPTRGSMAIDNGVGSRPAFWSGFANKLTPSMWLQSRQRGVIHALGNKVWASYVLNSIVNT